LERLWLFPEFGGKRPAIGTVTIVAHQGLGQDANLDLATRAHSLVLHDDLNFDESNETFCVRGSTKKKLVIR
jgi:hypothetical protein